MRDFTVICRDRSHSVPEARFAAAPGQLLTAIANLDCAEVDVLRAGSYAFSVQVWREGLWCLFRREPAEQRPAPTLGLSPLAG